MIRSVTLPPLTANSSGAGTVVSSQPLAGLLAGVNFVYSGTASPTVALMYGAGTILTVVAPNGWYFPTVTAHNGLGSALDAYGWPPIDGYVKAVMSGAGSAEALTATLLVEL